MTPFLNRPRPSENSDRDFWRRDDLFGQDDLLQIVDDIGVGVDLLQRHAAVDRLAHQPVVVGDAAGKMVAEDFLDVGLLDAVFEDPLLEAVDDDVGFHFLAGRLVDRLDQPLRVAQARHRHLGDDVELVGAEQHRLGPREPGARHVDHDIVEIGRDEVEHAHHEVGVERAHLRRPGRRGEHAQAARMLRQHHVEQLPVEALRLVLDLGNVEARLEVEIFGAGALLEIEVDDACRGAARHRVVQLERGLQGERRGADATGGGDEGIDLRFRVLLAPRPLQGADAGADQIRGGQWLHQEIGDLELDEYAHGGGVEFLGDDDDRRLAFQAPRDALQRLDLLQLAASMSMMTAPQSASWISPRNSVTFFSTVPAG